MSGGGVGAGRRRAPASEPPGTGAAAVDAEPEPEEVARAIALRMLAGAPRSRAQLAQGMAKRDVPEDVAEQVLNRFAEVGLIDDAAYAAQVVRGQQADRGLSRRALAAELRRRGVPPDTAAEALAQVSDDDETEAARRLVARKLAATRGLDPATRARRTLAALGRKGYSPGLVARLIREEQEGGDAWDVGALAADDPWDRGE